MNIKKIEKRINNVSNYFEQSILNVDCGEIPMAPYSACILLALNLYSYVINPFTEHCYFDYELLSKHAYIAQKICDDIIDLEIEKISKIIEKINNDKDPNEFKLVELNLWKKILSMIQDSRRTGLGITGLADAMAAMNIQYGNVDSINFASNVQKTISINSFNSSIDMGSDRGSFIDFDYNKEKGHILVEKLLQPNYVEKFKKYGRRNVSLTTIAPTGSVSIETQTSSGIEPVFMIFYRRKRKINPNDKNVNTLKIKPDQNGDLYEEYLVFHNKFIKWYAIKFNMDFEVAVKILSELSENDLNDLITQSPYNQSTAYCINWKDKIDLQSALQEYISHSISNTINLPKDITEIEVSDIYKYAWEKGCKGVTIYRDGCREQIMQSVTKDNIYDTNQFLEHSAPRRPKSMKCDVIKFNNKGEKWIGFLGLLNDKPYELFTGKLDSFNVPSYVESGFIIKNKENEHSRYDFQYTDADGYKVTMEALNRAFDREYDNYAKFVSGLLRHGMPILYVHQLIDSLRLDEDSINNWKSGVKRLIKKYIKEGVKSKNLCPICGQVLIFSEGCEKCVCGEYNKCG